jgi:hypothetical protein
MAVAIPYLHSPDRAKPLAAEAVEATCRGWRLSCNRIVGATALNDNQWYFGVFTFNGAVMKLYVNGVEDASVNTANAPRSDSIQKAGIGTAYTSTSVAGGFFNGLICGVAIWSEALAAADILALYNKGVLALRRERTIVYDAPDNQITHGANFANWSVDALGSTKGAGGITLRSDAGNYAEITVAGLSPNTDYWCRIDITAKSAGVTGELQVAALADSRAPNIAGMGGSPQLTGTTLVRREKARAVRPGTYVLIDIDLEPGGEDKLDEERHFVSKLGVTAKNICQKICQKVVRSWQILAGADG